MSSGRPTGAERSGGAPWGQGTAGNPGISCMSTTPAAPWAGGRAAPRAYAGQRGAYMVWSTRRERRAGQGLPSRAPTHTCQNRDFGPRQLAFPVPGGGGLAARPGAHPGHVRGREGRIWCGRAGRRAASAARAAQGAEGRPLVCRPEAVRAGIWGRGALCIRPGPGGWRQGRGAPRIYLWDSKGRRGRLKADRLGEGYPAAALS